MIKITKHGIKRTFKATCPTCNCEFEYQVEDLLTDYNLCLTSYPPQNTRYVKCPECGCEIFHDTIVLRQYSDLENKDNSCEEDKGDPCEKCPNKDSPKDVFGHPVAGESPCQWCEHYKWKLT